mgnify:CR=1 FL=1
MATALPYIAAAEVHAALDYPALVDALRRAFGEYRERNVV